MGGKRIKKRTCSSSCAHHSVPYKHRGTAPLHLPSRAVPGWSPQRSGVEAFNLHDLDVITGYFAEDCVFYIPRGAKPRRDRYVGKQEVRAGLAKRFEGIPDVHYGDDKHWICGDFGVSEWTLTGTSTSGQHIEVRGVDLLEFTQGKVVRKDSFWKIVE